MTKSILRQAIEAAGGITDVAAKCGVSYQGAHKWLSKGLPRTEWSGETAHAKTIGSMQRKFSASKILKSEKPTIITRSK